MLYSVNLMKCLMCGPTASKESLLHNTLLHTVYFVLIVLPFSTVENSVLKLAAFEA